METKESPVGLPPPTAGYWWIGRSPKGHQQMHYVGPGRKAPIWATMWTCEGMTEWVRFAERTAKDTDQEDSSLFDGEE